MNKYCPHCGVEIGLDEDTMKLFGGACPNCKKNVFEKPKCKFTFKKQKTPFVVNDYRSKNNADLMYSYTITGIKFDVDPDDLVTVYVTGEKTFEAPNVGEVKYAPFINWKMADPDDEIYSGHWDAHNVKVGETFTFTVHQEMFSDGGIVKFKIVSKE